MKSIFILIFSTLSISAFSLTCNYVENSLTPLSCTSCANVKICLAKVECKINEDEFTYSDVVCSMQANGNCPTADQCLKESNSNPDFTIYVSQKNDLDFDFCKEPNGYIENRRICTGNGIEVFGKKVGTLPSGAIGEGGETGGSRTGSIGKSATGKQGGVGCKIGSCPTQFKSKKIAKKIK